MENKPNDEKAKRRVHTRTNGTWYLVLRPITGGTLCGSKESTGLCSARLLTPPATLAQGRMQLTERCQKMGQEEEARDYLVRRANRQ